MAILVVGSVAYDCIETPFAKNENLLGGSANYFSLSASLLSQIKVVGVVGDDYAEKDVTLLTDRGVDLSGLQRVPGSTFKWSGKYETDMNEAITLDTQLNVFENFNPVIPEEFKKSSVVFLANIDPELQLKVLDQVENPKIVGADTMNFWISSKKDALTEVFKRINVLSINEQEARAYTGKYNLISVLKSLAEIGPRYVIMKRGEYGFAAYDREGDELFVMPAYAVENVIDPTGAGDTFAGGMLSYLENLKTVDFDSIKRACIHGSALASFTVQGLGVSKVKEVDLPLIANRVKQYLRSVSLGPLKPTDYEKLIEINHLA